ncbi:wax ester/triacylglycerol synthase family O-acyltransferase [Roseateles terrae]|nr:wax ester/triacylglycerol synthase family O-acyltransferase [Roseateles terrae]
MAAMDAAWLRLDTPTSRMVIVSLLMLRPSITLDALRGRVRERLLKHDRFRQRVVDQAPGPRWEEDPHFDLDHHVLRETLPRRRAQSLEAALKARVAALAEQGLDPAHPLWAMHLVEAYDGGSALIVRVHHCIADGLALIAVILSITDGGPLPGATRVSTGSGAAASSGAALAAGGGSADTDGWTDAFLKPINDWTVRALQQRAAQASSSPSASAAFPAASAAPAPASASASADVPAKRKGGKATRPLSDDGSAEAAGFLSAQMATDIAALAVVEDDSPTRLKGRPGRAKRVAWGSGVPLDAVQAVGKSLGVSVNDVLMSCVAGAIGAYLRAHGDDTRGQEIRAMVPVNLRPMEDAWQLGNRFGVVPLVLPIGLSNPVQRLYAVHSRMKTLKSSLQPVLAFGLMAAAGLLRPEQQRLLNDFQRKATAVMTNVPGPSAPLQFCGSQVDRVMFWVPQSGDVGVGVSLLTYAGQVQFGLLTDAGLCPDPQAIVDAFEPEFQRLLTLALMLPWEAGA